MHTAGFKTKKKKGNKKAHDKIIFTWLQVKKASVPYNGGRRPKEACGQGAAMGSV